MAKKLDVKISDEELEGRKLDRTLTFGLIGLFIVERIYGLDAMAPAT